MEYQMWNENDYYAVKTRLIRFGFNENNVGDAMDSVFLALRRTSGILGAIWVVEKWVSHNYPSGMWSQNLQPCDGEVVPWCAHPQPPNALTESLKNLPF